MTTIVKRSLHVFPFRSLTLSRFHVNTIASAKVGILQALPVDRVEVSFLTIEPAHFSPNLIELPTDLLQATPYGRGWYL